jgi:ketosteroid isomerase-like protein
MYTHPDPGFLVDGDFVVINWRFDVTEPSGKTWHLDELAFQRWRGDRVAEGRFFYDSAALPARPKTKA